MFLSCFDIELGVVEYFCLAFTEWDYPALKPSFYVKLIWYFKNNCILYSAYFTILEVARKDFAIFYLLFIANSYPLSILKYLPMALVNKITLRQYL